MRNEIGKEPETFQIENIEGAPLSQVLELCARRVRSESPDVGLFTSDGDLVEEFGPKSDTEVFYLRATGSMVKSANKA